MAFDFDGVKETVRQAVLRLDSPLSNYSINFSESEEAVEVRVERGDSIEPYFVFALDAEMFRIIKDLEINPNSYASHPYHSYIELLSLILQFFYPVFYKLNNGAGVTDMLSRVFNQKIRIWMDLLTVVCKAGDIEYYDFDSSFSVMGVNFTYNSEMRSLSLSGGLSETYKCQTVLELTVTLLTILSYIFLKDGVNFNPILGEEVLEEEEGFSFEEKDMESEFTPAEDSAEPVASDLDMFSIASDKEGPLNTNHFILLSASAEAGFSAWVGPSGNVLYVPSGKDHMDVVFQKPDVFSLNSRDLVKYKGYQNSGDGILDELYTFLYHKGWIRVRNFNKVFFASCVEPIKAIPCMRKWADDVLSMGLLKESTEVSFSGKDFRSSVTFTLGDLVQSSASVKSSMDLSECDRIG